MTYSTPQPGDLIATRSDSLVGTLIRFGESVRSRGWRKTIWSEIRAFFGVPDFDCPTDPWYYNHIAVIVDKDGTLIEALADGLIESNISKYRLYRVLSLEAVQPGTLLAERNSAVTFAKQQLSLHDSYGWLSIISIVVELLTPLKLDIGWDGAIICSAFGARCWEHAGVALPTLNPGTTLPSQLVDMVDMFDVGGIR